MTETSTLPRSRELAKLAPPVRIPTAAHSAGDQDEEWCEVRLNGGYKRIRFHDYDDIFAIPGLYERIFHEQLECDSPRVVTELIERALGEADWSPSDLSVLELGAGNGMVAEQLVDLGVSSVVGVDIIEEAAEAAERDRPGVYDDYHVLDLTDVGEKDHRRLAGHGFNCLVTVAALGFGDIPPEAFTAAYDLVEPDGWIAFNIKQDFVDADDPTGFARLIRSSVESGALELVDRHRYRHRLAVDGEPIHYVALVARKRSALGS